MKDIKKEVDALEVAMQVATDIKDKPYAYVVARIQEAILGNPLQVTPEPLNWPEPEWKVAVSIRVGESHRVWIYRDDVLLSSMLVRDKDIDDVWAFCDDLRSLQKAPRKPKRRWSLSRNGDQARMIYSEGVAGERTPIMLLVDSEKSYESVDALGAFLNDTQPWD